MQSYSIKRQHNGLLSFKKGHFSVKRSILGRALTKTFIHMPFVGTPFGITVPTKEKHKKHKVIQ